VFGRTTLGWVLLPSLGFLNLFWVPVGMAVGFHDGLLIAVKVGNDGSRIK
jgi:hypothetical protein